MVRRLSTITLFVFLLPALVMAAPGDRVRAGERHVLLTPAHPLTDTDQAELAARGIRIERPVSGGRYIARIEDGADPSADDRVGTVRLLTLADKVYASAWHTAAQARPFARVRLFFHDGVTVDAARDSVSAVGGTLEDPLALALEPTGSIVARIPSAVLADLAADDRVIAVQGVKKFRATTENFTSAALSHVSEVQASPYSLTGTGVVLSYFELGPAAATHGEFGGRLTVKFTCGSAGSDPDCADAGNQQHATHTAGTMIAAGLSAEAKGMAPKATLLEYRAADSDDFWLTRDKATSIRTASAIADNNSWGYITNWCPSSTCWPSGVTSNTDWVWTGDYAGAYDAFYNGGLDKSAYAAGEPLLVFSAGNEAGTRGPTGTWNPHNHVDDQFNVIQDKVYCYSANGSGTDCLAPCSSGAEFCETVPHPSYLPYGSIGILASSKNVMAVGAVRTNGTARAGFSSCGPTKDGRIKPEVVALGVGVYSTLPGTGCGLATPPAQCYGTLDGTSMAAPVVTGASALLVEQWRKTFGGATPSADVLKALEIAGADDLGNPGPDYDFGFGLLNAKRSIDAINADAGQGWRIKTETLSTGEQFDYPLTLYAAQDVRAVLTWFDPEILPLASDPVDIKTLVNDLDLKIVGPTGTVLPYILNPSQPSQAATRGVNTVDNTEEVEIAGAAAGTYHVIVSGTTVAKGPQQFVLVANADLGAALPPCTDVTEPNETSTQAYGPLVSGQPVTGRLCSASDADFFRFSTNTTGTITITVTATDTPLTVTLFTGDLAGTPVAVAAGATQTINATAGTAATQYYVRVVGNGATGSTGIYSVKVGYPYNTPAKRRGARH